MKIGFEKSSVLFVSLALWLGASHAGFAQQTLTVSPASTSNTYTGVITLNITGLNTGEQVIVARYLDLNGNGVVDPGEPLIDGFRISDGGASVIGGITNLNVPYDSNPTNGAITTTLNFLPATVMDTMVSHQIFQVVSPTNRFSPVSATLVVTNAALSQSVSGIVYSNGVTPFPYAVVVAQDQQANNPAGATVADATGHYFLTLPSSSYYLIAGFPNCYYNQNAAPSVILTNGMSATNNLSLTNGTVTISGNVADATNGHGIAGLLLQVQQKSTGYFAIAFTDSNGNYSAAVTSNFWTIQPDKQRLVRRAYVLPEATFQVDATSGSVSNANIALPEGNALFYGRMTDNSNHPLANVEIDGSTGNGSSSNSYDAKGYSDANGNYAVAILGDLTNYWGCSASSGKNTVLANYVVNFFGSVTNSPGQTTLDNFVALPATATITGHVQDNSGTNVTGVGLNANAVIGGNNYQSVDGTTDNSGNYLLTVASGQWNVQFFTGNFSDALDNHGYADLTGPHLVNIPPTNQTMNITVFPIGTPLIGQPQRISSTQFGFNINGASNVNYTVQVSTNLASTNWSSLFSFQLTTNPFPVVDTHATNSPRYYRVQKN
jgi:hypothetical protein